MAMIAAKCTNCGANIQVDETKEAGICESCGTAFITEKVINNYNINNTYNIQNAVINVKGANVDNLKKLGDEKIKSPNYPFEMDNYIKAQEYFSKVLEHEDDAEYKLKYDLCDKANHVDRTGAYEIVDIIDSVIEFITNDSNVNSNDENRVSVYANLISVMDDVVSAITMYYYERFSMGSLNYSVFITTYLDIVKKKLECADLMMKFKNLDTVNDTMISLCKSCEGDLASCISSYNVGGNYHVLSSEMCLEVKSLAERVQLIGEKYTSSYEVRNDILTCDTKNSNSGCYVATCVYGSYDCPQVWTLRRFRDNTLAEAMLGRVFIRTYYAISPTLVKWFGDTSWFKKLWKGTLDRMVSKLQANGVEDTPYQDRNWKI